MGTAAQILQPIVERLGWTLLHSVWQWTAIGLVAWLILRALRRRTPQVRYLAAVSLMAVGTITSVVTFTLAEPTNSSRRLEIDADSSTVTINEPAEAIGDEPAAESDKAEFSASGEAGSAVEADIDTQSSTANLQIEATSNGTFRDRIQHWLPLFVAIWLAGVVLLSLRLGISWVRLQRLTRKHATPIVDSLRGTADRLCERLGISTTVKLVESMRVHVPMAVGWLRPVVLFPAGIALGLSPDQLEALLAHELAHLARRDYLVNLAQCVVEILFFYHPVVWRLSRTIRCEREEACDDLAVSVLKSRIVYAQALTELAARELGNPAIAVAATGGGLIRRIERIVLPATVSSPHSRSTSAGILCLLFVAAAIVAAGAPRIDANSAAEPASNPDAAAAPQTERVAPVANSSPTNPSGALLPGMTPKNGESLNLPAFAGTVLNANGTPANGDVFLQLDYSYGKQLDGLRRPAYHFVQTKCVNGRFEFSAGEFPNPKQDRREYYRFNVIVQSPGSALAWWHIADPRPIEIKLQPESQLRGTVTHEGKPVAEAKVAVKWFCTKRELAWLVVDEHHTIDTRHPQTLEMPAILSTATDSKGTFELHGLPKESGVILDVDHPDYVLQRAYAATTRLSKEELRRDLDAKVRASRRNSVDRSKQSADFLLPKEIEVNPVPVQLNRGINIDISIVDAMTNAPISGARVDRSSWRPVAMRTTDAAGKVRLTRMRPGSIGITVHPPEESEYLVVGEMLKLSEEQPNVATTIGLHQGVVITGSVVDRETKKGILGANVNFYPSGSALRPVQSRLAAMERQGTSDAEGKFRLIVRPEEGRLLMLGSVPGYRNYESLRRTTNPAETDKYVRVLVPELGHPIRDVVFERERAPIFVARVLDFEGKPAPGTTVAGSVGWHGARDNQARAYLNPRTGIADEQGTLTLNDLFADLLQRGRQISVPVQDDLKPLPQTPYIELNFEHKERKLGARLVFEPPADESDVRREIRLEPMGTVTLQVVDSVTKMPVPNVEVHILRRTSDPFQRSSTTISDNQFTDANGRFQFDRILPGVEHAVTLDVAPSPGDNTGRQRTSVLEFTVPPGGTKDLGAVELPPSRAQVEIAEFKLPKVVPPEVQKSLELLNESAAAVEYAKLAQEHKAAFDAYRRELRDPKNMEIREQIIESMEPTTDYARAFFELGEKSKFPALACPSLVWVANCPLIDSSRGNDIPALRQKAVNLLLERYIDRPELAEGAFAILREGTAKSRTPLVTAEEIVARVLKANNDHAVQGKFYCALLEQYRDRAHDEQRDNFVGETKRCVELATLLRDKFSDLTGPFQRIPMKEYAEHELFELTRLQVGQIAPEIQAADLDGKALRFSDYHGKLVVLAFNWTSSDRYRLLKDLEEIQQYFQKQHPGSVEVIGVCNDDSPETARAKAKELSLSFRNLYEGPEEKLTHEWNIRRFPTIHIIDREGKIRVRNLRGLSDAGPTLERLLAEEAQKK